MTLPSVLMKDTLVGDGYTFGNSASSWSLWIGKMPSSPDRAVCIYDSGGRNSNPAYLLDYPSVQIRVRGGQNDYQQSGEKAQEIQERLLGRESYDHASGDRIVSITSIGDCSFLGWDNTNRPEWVFNLALIVEPSPATTPTNRVPL